MRADQGCLTTRPTRATIAMIWTIFAALAVLATKFITAMRLKDLKAKFEAIQPHIEELRQKVAEAEDELAGLRMREEATQTKLTHMKGVVQYLETSAKAPANQPYMDEREQILQATVEEPV